jgi:hypothetical protein
VEVGCTPYEPYAELESPIVTILRASRRELTFLGPPGKGAAAAAGLEDSPLSDSELLSLCLSVPSGAPGTPRAQSNAAALFAALPPPVVSTLRKTRLELELEEVEREGCSRVAPALAEVWVARRARVARKLAAAQQQTTLLERFGAAARAAVAASAEAVAQHEHEVAEARRARLVQAGRAVDAARAATVEAAEQRLELARAELQRAAARRAREEEVEVRVSVYSLGKSTALRRWTGRMRALGVGAFHAAVQIGDMEWSFGYTPPWAGETTGVFACPPRECTMHTFIKEHRLGAVSAAKAREVLEELQHQPRWFGQNYKLIENNCCSFCEELVAQLNAPRAVCARQAEAAAVARARARRRATSMHTSMVRPPPLACCAVHHDLMLRERQETMLAFGDWWHAPPDWSTPPDWPGGGVDLCSAAHAQLPAAKRAGFVAVGSAADVGAQLPHYVGGAGVDRPPRYLVRAMKLGGRVEGVSEGVDALERRLEQRLHQLTVRCLTPCDAALGKLVRAICCSWWAADPPPVVGLAPERAKAGGCAAGLMGVWVASNAPVLALPVLLLLLATAHPVGDEPALPALSCRPAACANGPLPLAHAAGVVWADTTAAAAAANGSQTALQLAMSCPSVSLGPPLRVLRALGEAVLLSHALFVVIPLAAAGHGLCCPGCMRVPMAEPRATHPGLRFLAGDPKMYMLRFRQSLREGLSRVASCLNCSLLVGTAVLFGYTVLLLVVLSYRLLDRWELCAGAAAADDAGLAWRLMLVSASALWTSACWGPCCLSATRKTVWRCQGGVVMSAPPVDPFDPNGDRAAARRQAAEERGWLRSLKVEQQAAVRQQQAARSAEPVPSSGTAAAGGGVGEGGDRMPYPTKIDRKKRAGAESAAQRAAPTARLERQTLELSGGVVRIERI